VGIESLLPDSVKIPVLGVITLVIVLSALASRYPAIEWLQRFRVRDNRSDEQKARARRSSNILAGAEMVMMGLAIPFVYGIATVMFFNDFGTGEMLVVGAVSLLCVGLGMWTLAKARSS
jgi:hypothetical protein